MYFLSTVSDDIIVHEMKKEKDNFSTIFDRLTSDFLLQIRNISDILLIGLL